MPLFQYGGTEHGIPVVLRLRECPHSRQTTFAGSYARFGVSHSCSASPEAGPYPTTTRQRDNMTTSDPYYSKKASAFFLCDLEKLNRRIKE
ncbi:hypothetical protein [Algoriphagus sp. AK58]|uniref:hypothetical protein n=1 Tax=Algoriphagus sp. AK58 TaxID=1406877 RepID=UPI00164FD82B|nr:hypothetical protein [Algoriphagus sp. AK58]